MPIDIKNCFSVSMAFLSVLSSLLFAGCFAVFTFAAKIIFVV
jgi:hypothetical protein